MSLPSPDSRSTVLITGASAGIGTELARQLAARGHHVTLVARRRERLEELAGELDARPTGAAGATVDVCDLADESARAELITKLKRRKRRVAGVCNNAGYGGYGRFDLMPLEREVEEVRLNVGALHELTGAFLPDMVERGEGAILNVASTAAFQPVAGFATYGATKAFVLAFSEAVHAELAGTGVSVTALCPGPTRSEFGETAGMGDMEKASPNLIFQSAETVARAGIEAMVAGRRSVIPGVRNKASAFGGRFVPRTLLLPVTRRAAGKRLLAPAEGASSG
jgi:short-subunit dehydrogenase